MTSSSMTPPIEPAVPATFLTVRQITRIGTPCPPVRDDPCWWQSGPRHHHGNGVIHVIDGALLP
jgi:hypothetical protein